MRFDVDAYVTQALFEESGRAVFTTGDGRVLFESGETLAAHPDAGVLCAALHPSGEGVLTGGDDGRLVWARAGGFETVAEAGGRWIDAVCASAASGLIAFAAGRDVQVRDAGDPGFLRHFLHERAVADLCFDPKGRRLACATYGGATLWFARIADQKPHWLRRPGAHVALSFSPDGRFLISAMQENALHGWRLSDGADMRMGGYPAKPRSLCFLGKGRLLATSGSEGAVVWPFSGANGPIGQAASEVGRADGVRVVRVAAVRDQTRLVAGLDSGEIWIADLAGSGRSTLRAPAGSPVTALAVSIDGRRAAFGVENGEAGVLAI